METTGRQYGGIYPEERMYSLGKLGESVGTTVLQNSAVNCQLSALQGVYPIVTYFKCVAHLGCQARRLASLWLGKTRQFRIDFLSTNLPLLITNHQTDVKVANHHSQVQPIHAISKGHEEVVAVYVYLAVGQPAAQISRMHKIPWVITCMRA